MPVQISAVGKVIALSIGGYGQNSIKMLVVVDKGGGEIAEAQAGLAPFPEAPLYSAYVTMLTAAYYSGLPVEIVFDDTLPTPLLLYVNLPAPAAK